MQDDGGGSDSGVAQCGGQFGGTDPGVHERVFAVLADGLRPPRPQT